MKIMYVTISTLSIFCKISAMDIYASNTTALQLASRDTQLARVGGGATGTLAVRSAAENTEIARIPSYQYADSFELSGENQENAVITFNRGYQTGDIFRRESSIDKTYPYERTFLSLEPASGTSSYAVYSLSVNTEELGRLQLTDHFVDRSLALPHQTRFVVDHYDYDNLKAIGTLVTFVIDRDHIERQVSSVPNSTQSYEVRTEKDDKYLDNPNGGDNVRVYVRPDGVEVRKNWEGVALIEKPSHTCPVEANIEKLVLLVEKKSFDLLNIMRWEYRLNKKLPFFAKRHFSRN